MPKRDVDLLLEDIRNAVGKIQRYVARLDRAAFLQDEKSIDAVVRNLEIIGEATKQFPAGFTALHPGIPWRQLAGLRNRIAHDYFGLDVEIVWEIVHHDLPVLSAALEKLI
jgi:uncharacterized protein with HEPN domain